jgi:hypothetical protein
VTNAGAAGGNSTAAAASGNSTAAAAGDATSAASAAAPTKAAAKAKGKGLLASLFGRAEGTEVRKRWIASRVVAKGAAWV